MAPQVLNVRGLGYKIISPLITVKRARSPSDLSLATWIASSKHLGTKHLTNV